MSRVSGTVLPISNRKNGALSGLCIVDLTTVILGPYATMLLADQGNTRCRSQLASDVPTDLQALLNV